MKQMNFLSNDCDFENPSTTLERCLLYQIWQILKGEELGGISKRNLCQFLLVLIGIPNFKLNSDTYSYSNLINFNHTVFRVSNDIN